MEAVTIDANKRAAWTQSWGAAEGAEVHQSERYFFVSTPINAAFGNAVLRFDLKSDETDEEAEAQLDQVLDEYKAARRPMVFLLSTTGTPQEVLGPYEIPLSL